MSMPSNDTRPFTLWSPSMPEYSTSTDLSETRSARCFLATSPNVWSISGASTPSSLTRTGRLRLKIVITSPLLTSITLPNSDAPLTAAVDVHNNAQRSTRCLSNFFAPFVPLCGIKRQTLSPVSTRLSVARTVRDQYCPASSARARRSNHDSRVASPLPRPQATRQAHATHQAPCHFPL